MFAAIHLTEADDEASSKSFGDVGKADNGVGKLNFVYR